ncbi:uncharacterized protein [Heterodontus francisci]|uniref:uncharacterized protein isoform X2 n=1 Tax=Heterodontus francisci TaxID=7792 RepID=UPI00355B329D
MSIMWSLVNISKEQQFSLMLYALCLIVQWSCHCSAKEQATLANPSITTAKNISAQSDVPSTTKSILDKYGGLNTSTENSIFELSDDQGNATTPILQSSKSTLSKLHYTETTVIPGADSGSSNEKTGEIPKMQTEGRHNKASQPVVLISLIFCGLFLAATIMAVYYRLNKRTWSPNSKRLRTNQMHMRSQN